MSQFDSVVIAVWCRMQLLRRLQALRARGLKVKRRGWFLVIDGGKAKGQLLFQARGAMRAKLRIAQLLHS